jgi:hypothetical protein
MCQQTYEQGGQGVAGLAAMTRLTMLSPEMSHWYCDMYHPLGDPGECPGSQQHICASSIPLAAEFVLQ